MKLKPCTLIFTLFVGLVALSSCSKDDDGAPVELPFFDKFQAMDQDNLGNSADIHLSYALSGDISIMKELRLFVTKSSTSQSQLLRTSGFHYHVLPLSDSLQTFLEADLTDVEGRSIKEGIDYKLYIMGVFKNRRIAPILSDPTLLTLSNQTIVITPVLTGPFNASEDIAIAEDGTLYINGGGTSPANLYKVTPDGESSILSSDMDYAVGMTLDEAGNIYTSNFSGPVIKKVTPSGAAVDYVTDERLVGGGGLAFDQAGNLFNTFYASTTLFRITANQVDNFTSNDAFNGPVGVTYDKERGKLYVSSFNDGKIFHVDADGGVTEVADTPASIGHISYANDHFYVSGWRQYQVFKVSLGGEVITTIGSGEATDLDGTAAASAFIRPNGIEATADGRYVYVSQGNGKLRKIIMARED